jgi:hypothetical protein
MFGLCRFCFSAGVVQVAAGDIDEGDGRQTPVDEELVLRGLAGRLELLYNLGKRRREHGFLDRRKHICVILPILQCRFDHALLRAEQNGDRDVGAASDQRRLRWGRLLAPSSNAISFSFTSSAAPSSFPLLPSYTKATIKT